MVITRLHEVVSEAKAAGFTATEIKNVGRKCAALDSLPRCSPHPTQLGDSPSC